MSRPCKIGTIPYQVVLHGSPILVVGSIRNVRKTIDNSKWFRVLITRINEDGYFFCDLI